MLLRTFCKELLESDVIVVEKRLVFKGVEFVGKNIFSWNICENMNQFIVTSVRLNVASVGKTLEFFDISRNIR